MSESFLSVNPITLPFLLFLGPCTSENLTVQITLFQQFHLFIPVSFKLIPLDSYTSLKNESFWILWVFWYLNTAPGNVTNFLPVFKGYEAMGLPVLLAQQESASSVLVLRRNKICLNMNCLFLCKFGNTGCNFSDVQGDNYSQTFQLFNLLNMGKLSLSPFTYFVTCI